MIKPVAFYLPQFHEIPENDLWWEKGFTEWTGIKKWNKNFSSHQIKKPHPFLGYYNLLDKDTRRYQGNLAKEFGVYGFCYYHYWSCGQKLLEKPLELMLHDGEPDLPFMLCWANHNWTRKWDGLDKEVLWEQKYGAASEWIDHYKYLSSFFKNKNYIKIDNKPCFTLLWHDRIVECSQMIELWQRLAKEDGFDGLHIITTMGWDSIKKEGTQDVFDRDVLAKTYIDACLLFEPSYSGAKSISPLKKIENYSVYDTEIFHKQVENNKFNNDKKIYRSTLCGWDNSPRTKDKAIIFTEPTPKEFENHLRNLFKIVEEEKSEFVFINAWNEWGEGAVLEPDDRHGLGYLESIKTALLSV